MPLPTQYAIRNTPLAERVQSYLHHKSRAGWEALIVGGFTLYLHGRETGSDVSLVLPNRGDARLTDVALARMERVFGKRGHALCFQWLDSFAPGLGEQLSGRGFAVQERLPLLAATPGQVTPPAQENGLAFVTLRADSALEDVAESWNINARGFDSEAALAEPGDVESFRSSLTSSRAFTARLNGTGVSAGMYTDIYEGVTELVGIATLPEYRRRGYGGALTAYAAQCAFANGAEVVFLTAASPEAGRVYQRVGFGVVGELVMLTKRLTPSDK